MPERQKYHILTTTTWCHIKWSLFLLKQNLNKKKFSFKKMRLVSLYLFLMQICLHKIISLLLESPYYFKLYECLSHTFVYSCPKSNSHQAMPLTQQERVFCFTFVPSWLHWDTGFFLRTPLCLPPKPVCLKHIDPTKVIHSM